MALSFSACVEVIAFTAMLTAAASWRLYHALSDTFPIGTLRAMITDAGWHDEDLKRLGLVE